MSERYIEHIYGHYSDGSPLWYPITEREALSRLSTSALSASNALMRLARSCGNFGRICGKRTKED